MGLDITLQCMSPSKCPHCGKPIESFPIGDEINLSGGNWRPLLDKIGYGDGQNGQHILLTPHQLKLAYDAIKDVYDGYYGRQDALNYLARAIVDGTDVIIEADW